jgi:hypothetical protein
VSDQVEEPVVKVTVIVPQSKIGAVYAAVGAAIGGGAEVTSPRRKSSGAWTAERRAAQRDRLIATRAAGKIK